MKIEIENYQNCQLFSDNRSRAVFKDAKASREYIAKNLNKKELKGLRVDDCLITDGQKCDYLLININDKTIYFIELKGSDLIKAIDQIDRTLDILLPKFEHQAVHGRVVLSKVNTPNLVSSRYIKLKKRLKDLNGTLEQKSIQMEENI
jgi:hypothetical protein